MKKSALLILICPLILSGCFFTKAKVKPTPEPETFYESKTKTPMYVAQGMALNVNLYKMKGVSSDIPYIDFISTYNNILLPFMGVMNTSSSDLTMVGALQNNVFEAHNYYGSLLFDEENDTIRVSSIYRTMFFLSQRTDYLMPAAGQETNYARFNSNKTRNVTDAEVVTFDLGKYNIDLLRDGKNLYMPFATFADIFLASNGLPFAYNGKDIYYTGQFSTERVSLDSNNSLEASFFNNSPWKNKKRSSELAEFTYNELCFSLDHLYGLKDYRSITSFDTLLTNGGWKQNLLSTNADTYERAMINFVGTYLCEGHTGFLKVSPFNPTSGYDTAYKAATTNNARYTNLINKMNSLKSSRSNAHKDIGLTVQDNVAIIRFDSFMKSQGTTGINVDNYTYADLHDADTYLFFKKAFNEIAEDSDITKVVFDITLNGGGMLDALPWLGAFISDDPSYTMRSSLNGMVSDIHFNVDLNRDYYITEEDTYKGKYDFYLMTSSFSFSCANAFATYVKSSGSATIIGEKSGGGACAVGALTTASGTTLRLSSTIQMGLLDDQDNFVINEDGIEVDYEFSSNYFYNDSQIAQFVNNH